MVGTSSSSTAPLGLFITLPLVWTGLIVLGGIASAVIAWAPEHRQPTVLALTVLPIIGVGLAGALSEALKHNVPSIGNAVFIAAAALAVPLTALLGAGVAAAWQAPRLRTALIAAGMTFVAPNILGAGCVLLLLGGGALL